MAAESNTLDSKPVNDTLGWASARFAKPSLARLRISPIILSRRCGCDFRMLLTAHHSAVAWSGNACAHGRAGPEVPELDPDALLSDPRGIPVPLLPESLRACRWPEIDRAGSGIMTRQEREIQFRRRCMPGFPDMVRVWKLARCTAVS